MLRFLNSACYRLAATYHKAALSDFRLWRYEVDPIGGLVQRKIRRSGACRDAKLLSFDQSLADMLTNLTKLPLIHQPGTAWEYSLSRDVLGRVVRN